MIDKFILEKASRTREDDGLLHCSSDIVGSIRHIQLRHAGAPTLPLDTASTLRLNTGTLWHEWLSQAVVDSHLPVMVEVSLSDGLPDKWSGTADIFWWEGKGFRLYDLKTVRSEALRFRVREGISEEHLWQISAYYHAAREIGLPLASDISVIYLPITGPTKSFAKSLPPEKLSVVQGKPIVLSSKPLPKDMVWERMKYVDSQVQPFRELPQWSDGLWEHIRGKLYPESPPVQKLVNKKGMYELQLAPHWLNQFCPYPDEYCSCNHQKPIKIGTFNEFNDYYPVKGYEDIRPEIFPSTLA